MNARRILITGFGEMKLAAKSSAKRIFTRTKLCTRQLIARSRADPGTQKWHEATRRRTCQNGDKNSPNIWWLELQPEGAKHLALRNHAVQCLDQKKKVHGSISVLHTLPEGPRTAKHADGPKSHKCSVQNAPKQSHTPRRKVSRPGHGRPHNPQ